MLNQKGFSQLILLIIVGAVVVMVGGGFWYYRQSYGSNDKYFPGIQATPKSSTIPKPVATQSLLPKVTFKPTASPTLINGKTLETRLAEATSRLHAAGSGENIRQNFPDITLVYTDDAAGTPFPNYIIPFRYYYSKEANTTFSICKPDITTFICKGKLDKLLRQGDLDSGRCNLTEQLSGDPRL